MQPLRQPSWINAPGRWGVGLRFQCPTHGDGCFLVAYFLNPVDGGPVHAPDNVVLYFQDIGGLGSINLFPEFRLGEHGAFSIEDGKVKMWLH